MKAVVMAGGEGSRLRPLTVNRPKPMITMVNRPVMEHVLLLLRRHGITDVIVTLQYLASVIQDHFGDGSSLGLNIQYLVEAEPLGTAGSVRAVVERIDDTFLVVSADALTDCDLAGAVRFHRERGALATLVLYSVPNPEEYGVVVTDERGRVQQFLEKPRRDEVFSDLANTGLYVLEPDVFAGLPPTVPTDFSHDVFPELLRRGAAIYGYPMSGYWCDVGTLAEYRRACADMLGLAVDVGGLGRPIGGGVWCRGDDVEIAPDAQLYGPIYLGDAVKIKGGVVIHGPSVIEDNAIVDARSRVEQSIIGRGSYVGEGATLRGAILGRQCSVKNLALLFDDVVVGDRTVVGESAVLQPGIHIWPNKAIEPGATVTQSLVWGAQGRRSLFGRWGVTGLANIEITPEFAARLGAAYGATLPRGATVTINRDPHRTPRMIKRALIAGIPGAGVDVIDLKSVPIPVARFITRSSDAVGGLHVRLSPFDNRVVDVKFFGEDGLDIRPNAERAIENTYFREDFRRAYLDEVGGITELPDAPERYGRAFLSALDVGKLTHGAGRRLWAFDYANSPVALVLPRLLDQLGLPTFAVNTEFEYRSPVRSNDEFDQGLRALATLVADRGAALGVRFEPGGEKIFFVDPTGSVLPSWTALAVMADLTLAECGGGTLAVPVTAPSLFEQLAARHGGAVVRTRTPPSALMLGAEQPGVVLAGDGAGGFIFPDHAPYFDGLYASVRLMQMLPAAGRELQAVVAGLPDYAQRRREVPCPWDAKARILRRLAELVGNGGSVPSEGIRSGSGDEWVIVLSDPDKPLFQVIADAATPRTAEAMLDRFANLIEELAEAGA